MPDHTTRWDALRQRSVSLPRELVWLLLLALAVRAGYWALVLRDYVPASDAAHYHEIGRHLAEGEGFAHWFPQIELHPTAFRPPLFPLVLGLAYAALWPAVAIAQGLNLLLGVAAVALTWVLVTDVGGRTAGTVAAGIVAVYPPLVANDLVPLAESLALVLFLALAIVLRRDAPAVAGLLTGLLVLDRTSAQGVALLVVAWVAVRRGLRKAAVTLVVTVAVIAPWVVRNAIQLDAPVLVTSNGFNLAAMHSPEARASGHFVDPVFDHRFEQFRLDQFDEAAWDRALRRYAVAEIRRDPVAVLEVVGRNAAALFELRPSFNESAERLDGRHAGFRSATLPLFYVVSGLGLVGLWSYRRDPTVVLLVLVAGYFVALSLLLVAPPRLRWPFDVLCAVGVGLLASRVRARRSPVAAAAG